MIHVSYSIPGCGCANKLGANHGYLGSLIVDKQHRGKGLGTELLKSLISYLQNDGPRNIGLLAGHYITRFYTKYGWAVPSWETVSYIGKPCPNKLNIWGQTQYKLVATSQFHLDRVLEYDRVIHTIPRDEYVRQALKGDGIYSYVAVEVESDRVVGLATLRPTHEGHRLAPLYANNQGIAFLLLSMLLGCTNVSLLTVDCVEPNSKGGELARLCGLKEDYRLQTLYTEREVPVQIEKIYALANTDYHFA